VVRRVECASVAEPEIAYGTIPVDRNRAAKKRLAIQNRREKNGDDWDEEEESDDGY
jgi:hypothetical protein